MPANQEKMNLE